MTELFSYCKNINSNLFEMQQNVVSIDILTTGGLSFNR